MKIEKCLPCEGLTSSLASDEVKRRMLELPEWTLSDDQKNILRKFEFKNFYRVMAFVNWVAWISHQQNHHPDLEVSYNFCVVKYTTHALDGLSHNDFICALQISSGAQNCPS